MPGSEREIRLRRLRELIADGGYRSQESLAARLQREGFSATQSGLSRDLRDLGVGKIGGVYRLPGGPGPDAPEPSRLDELVERIEAAGPNLLVIHTATGGAARVGLEIDRAGWPGVVGTIAGDDTVFVATLDGRRQTGVRRRIAAAGKGNAS